MRFLILLVVAIAFLCPNKALAQDIFGEIQASHIDGNVPAGKNFEAFLTRDLKAYFKVLLKKMVAVKYEPLRNGATQSGVSYPKYYLWVTATVNKEIVTQGAVRVAAIDKTYFEVTDFLSVSDLRKNPKAIDETFPLPVGAKIRERLRKQR